jgi:ferredoxin
VRVTVDAEVCQGHARCWDVCPEVFSLDDAGHAFVSVPDVPAALEARVEQAVNVCPERAITLAPN